MPKSKWLMAEAVPEQTEAAPVVAEEKDAKKTTWWDDDVIGSTSYYSMIDASAVNAAEMALASRARRQQEPEISLLEAILQEALVAIRAPENRKTKGVKADTIAWIESDDEEWVFSFVSICEALQLSHSEVRKRVMSPIDDAPCRMYRKSASYLSLRKRPYLRKSKVIDGTITESDNNGCRRLNVA